MAPFRVAAIARGWRGGHRTAVTRAALFSRPAGPLGIAFCLVALVATGGCAHFRDGLARSRAAEAAESAARAPVAKPRAESVQPAPAQPVLALAEAPPPPAPPPAPAVPPSPAPLPVAPPESPVRPIVPAPSLAAAQPAKAEPPARAPMPEAPAQVALAPAPAPAAPPADQPSPASTETAPAANPITDQAIIVFANAPGTHCSTCETVKISVAPSGGVLIERGHWDSGHRAWRYRRAMAHVEPARAVDFAARLGAYRQAGERVLTGGTACPGPSAGDDGLTIEWIAASRHDLLTVRFGCPAGRASSLAETLRHAPDLLGLRQVAFPWDGDR